MESTFQAATPAERLYTTRQSTQIEGQTGSIGHLRADMGGDGKGWAIPAADPKNYDEQGQPIKSRRPNRGGAR